MSALADSIPIVGTTDAADRRRRIIAIVGASSGNLVEWSTSTPMLLPRSILHQHFSQAATQPVSCWPPPAFSPWAFSCGRLRLAVRLDRRQARPPHLDGYFGAYDVRGFADDRDNAY